MPREKLFGPPPRLHALNGVSFTIEAGRSLGVVGESGSGKSTLARLVMALDRPTAAPECPPDLRRELAVWFQPSVDRLVELGYIERAAWSDFA